MTGKEIIQETVNYIEAHIEEKLTAEEIADSFGYSLYYFHRLFTTYTGVSLVAYVRGRKLAHARVDLMFGLRIIDIAVKYGYASERSFTRAFKKHFVSTPSSSRELPYALKPAMIIHNINTSHKKGEWTMDYLSDVSFVTLEAMKVVSMTRIGTEPEEAVISAMHQYLTEKGIETYGYEYGFDVPVSDEKSERGIRGYEYWAKVPESYKDDQVEIKEIPGYKYAKLTITNPFEDPLVKIPNGWKAIVAWMEVNQSTGTAPKAAACLEKVVEIEGLSYMDIMIPFETLKIKPI